MNISLLEELKTFFIPAGYKHFAPKERSNKSLELYCQNIESIRSLPLPVLIPLCNFHFSIYVLYYAARRSRFRHFRFSSPAHVSRVLVAESEGFADA